MSHIKAENGVTRFPVGKMGYDVIIVPAMETIRKATLQRLEAFKKAGGRIIFLGNPPKYTDAIPDDKGKQLWANSEHIGFERLPILAAGAQLDLRVPFLAAGCAQVA
ncbi:hypothetical protein FACS1894109_19710 [Spirochaetia bacterium]|nr:hypothetical protein FACS1894109_19710 [Spirochaetia bacterium]